MMRLALLLALAALPAGATTRLALVVGHNLGDSHELPLRWAEADAERIHGLLTSIGNVPSSEARLLRSPTVASFREAHGALKQRVQALARAGEHTVLFFYYSGHADSEALHFGEEKLDAGELRRELRSLGATTTVAVVDACQNDRAPRATSKGALRAPAFAWPSEQERPPAGFVFLTSAARGEVAQESDDLEGSLFTHHLLAGIRGSADGDDDGAVTLEELYRYSYAHTLRDTHGGATAVQHSELDVRLAGQGSLVLAFVKSARALLELDPAVHGHLLIVDDASGRIVAEYQRSPGGPGRVAMSPGRYRIQLRREGEIRVGLIEVSDGVTRLSLDELEARPAVALLRKGSGADPYPTRVGAAAAVATSAVKEFGALPLVQLWLDHHLWPRVRVGPQLAVGYSRVSAPIWRYAQLEWSALAAADWEVMADPVALLLGARLGLTAVHQQGRHQQEGRIAQVVEAETRSSSMALGPKAALSLAAERWLGPRMALRLSAEPALWLLRVDGSLQFGWGGQVGIGAALRL